MNRPLGAGAASGLAVWVKHDVGVQLCGSASARGHAPDPPGLLHLKSFEPKPLGQKNIASVPTGAHDVEKFEDSVGDVDGKLPAEPQEAVHRHVDIEEAARFGADYGPRHETLRVESRDLQALFGDDAEVVAEALRRYPAVQEDPAKELRAGVGVGVCEGR